LAIVFLAGGVLSLVIAPMAWPFVLAYVGAGFGAGLLAGLGQFGGIVGLVIIYCVAKASTFLNQVEGTWHQAWWQPGVLALVGSSIAYLVRRREPSE
jgi:hypothetical protein